MIASQTNKLVFQLDGQTYFNGVIPAAATVEMLKTWSLIEQTYLKGGRLNILPDGTSRPASTANVASTATRARPASKKKRH